MGPICPVSRVKAPVSSIWQPLHHRMAHQLLQCLLFWNMGLAKVPCRHAHLGIENGWPLTFFETSSYLRLCTTPTVIFSDTLWRQPIYDSERERVCKMLPTRRVRLGQCRIQCLPRQFQLDQYMSFVSHNWPVPFSLL